MAACFVIVGKGEPLYTRDFAPAGSTADDAMKRQYSLHSGLDMVDEAVWNTSSTYLKVVDRVGDSLISAYVTPGQVRFMLLHRNRSEDAVKSFFTEVHTLYLKALLNPFYKPHSPITAKGFDAKVKTLAQRYL